MEKYCTHNKLENINQELFETYYEFQRLLNPKKGTKENIKKIKHWFNHIISNKIFVYFQNIKIILEKLPDKYSQDLIEKPYFKDLPEIFKKLNKKMKTPEEQGKILYSLFKLLKEYDIYEIDTEKALIWLLENINYKNDNKKHAKDLLDFYNNIKEISENLEKKEKFIQAKKEALAKKEQIKEAVNLQVKEVFTNNNQLIAN
jgi:hypothetical protein